MAYTPRSWADGELVTAEDLNRIEQGVTDAIGLAARLAALEYDSGQRNVSGDLTNGWSNFSHAPLTLSRIGSEVTLSGYLLPALATDDTFYTVPPGFRPSSYVPTPAVRGNGGNNLVALGEITRTAANCKIFGTKGSGTTVYYMAKWSTRDPAPTTPPGTPA